MYHFALYPAETIEKFPQPRRTLKRTNEFHNARGLTAMRMEREGRRSCHELVLPRMNVRSSHMYVCMKRQKLAHTLQQRPSPLDHRTGCGVRAERFRFLHRKHFGGDGGTVHCDCSPGLGSSILSKASCMRKGVFPCRLSGRPRNRHQFNDRLCLKCFVH